MAQTLHGKLQPPPAGSYIPTQGVYGKRFWQQQQSTKPLYVLKSLCPALFAASYLSTEVNTRRDIRDFKDTTLADIIAKMINLPGSKAEPNRPLPPHHYFSKWLFESQNLYFYGRTLADWINLHKASNRLRYDLLENKVARRLVDMKYELAGPNTNATEALENAVKIAALAGMKTAVGKERQIPGLVPVNARQGDLIALMPHSNLPIILRPIDDDTARFIGVTCIYILGPPVDQSLTRLRSFGDYWGLHDYWDKSNDVWFPVGFKQKENWQRMRII
jgi:hypothetical protein